MNTTPELDKLHQARAAGSDTIGEFIDWLQTSGYVIAQWVNPRRQVDPDVLVYDQDSNLLHHSTSRLQPAICGVTPKLTHSRYNGGWYGKLHSWAMPNKNQTICRKCSDSYAAGEWPEIVDETPKLFGVHKPIEQWLADYYGIDLNKVDAERSALLTSLRSSHGAAWADLQSETEALDGDQVL